MDIKYERVYKLRDVEQAIFRAQRKLTDAEQHVNDAQRSYREACATVTGLPVERLRFSNVACMASGIASHVYEIDAIRPGANDRCIYCGCDDFDI